MKPVPPSSRPAGWRNKPLAGLPRTVLPASRLPARLPRRAYGSLRPSYAVGQRTDSLALIGPRSGKIIGVVLHHRTVRPQCAFTVMPAVAAGPEAPALYRIVSGQDAAVGQLYRARVPAIPGHTIGDQDQLLVGAP